MIGEPRAATVSATDLEHPCSFYRDAFACTRHAEAEVAGREAELFVADALRLTVARPCRGRREAAG
jgi:hypothetical protein